MNLEKIRNFCIIAHIDHGKSTLADRLLELTGTVEKRDMKEQLLDSMDLERERGITIKLQPVRMEYEGNILNLIDTPGHVDFSYEVSRSLACCEGALLVVDATQGIEAQTLANLYLAIEQDLEIIPVLNKIDLPAADVKKVTKEVVGLLGCDEKDIIPVSAKTGENVEAVLKAVVEKVPEPKTTSDKTRALIFDSVFDDYRGVITYVRVFDGKIKKGDRMRLLATQKESEVLEVGFFKPKMKSENSLSAGDIGYIVTGFKEVAESRVGDTVTILKNQASEPLAGYKEVKPMVFAGIFCQEGNDYPELKEAMEKLKLNDAAMIYEPERSTALGFGFRAGFLGLLHLDIVQERLKREFNLDLIVTVPSVAYKVTTSKGEEKIISSPLDLPDPNFIDHVEEPMMMIDVVTPSDYIGGIMTLLQEKRGIPVDNQMEYLDEFRVVIHYKVPLSQIVVDFYDKLKNISSGYASLNYDFAGYQTCTVSRMDILVATEPVEALASIVYKDEVQRAGRKIAKALKDVLPRQMFEVRVQAAVGGKIYASEKIPAMRKDVTAKLYGGDVTRKRKLLEKQKAGKKKMKAIGKVDIPQEAFLAVLKR
ncbi:translation elongation factor 4 [Patescibacteria group bacterium]|nr:translation elongation factor 4 [Patescibacteria group bacterium]MBU1673726.1 translation elongation factor 4 [Patescibacteria group bacterium]MBU1963044.1 translation elongation factor 4 [Patescibacteria group bacterium]